MKNIKLKIESYWDSNPWIRRVGYRLGLCSLIIHPCLHVNGKCQLDDNELSGDKIV